MYLIDTYDQLTTTKDKDFLGKCFPYLTRFLQLDLKYRTPKTRIQFFITIYHNISEYEPNNSIGYKILDAFFDYMINNLDLIELMEEVSPYSLFEEKTYCGNIDNYIKNYHLQNQINMKKLVQKLPPAIVENYIKSSDILNSFFNENYAFVSWKSYYFIKTLAKIGVDLNLAPLMMCCKTFVNQKKFINWNKTRYYIKLIYFLIEIGYSFDSLYINTHFNIFIKKMIAHFEMRENCYRTDNVLGRLFFDRNLQKDNIETIFK